MRARAAGVSDVGRERDHNEDRFALLHECDVWMVCDGMGGHQCGEVASQMAIGTLSEFFRSAGGADESSSPVRQGDLGSRLRQAFEDANRRIHQRAANSPAHRGMGTTAVAAAFHHAERRLYVVHAGDSRCYRFRSGALEQVTRDHSLIEEALRTRPEITREELSFLPSNVITRALGVDANVTPDVNVRDVLPGDVFLLCSDGLHGFVPDARIRELLEMHSELEAACAALIDEANGNGGGDNITAVLVRLERTDEDEVFESAPRPESTDPRELREAIAPASMATPSARFRAAIEDAPTEADDIGGIEVDEDSTPITARIEGLARPDDTTPYTAAVSTVPRARIVTDDDAVPEDDLTPPSLAREIDFPLPDASLGDPAPKDPSAPAVAPLDDEFTPPSLNRDFDLPLPPPLDDVSDPPVAGEPTPPPVLAPPTVTADSVVEQDELTPPSLNRDFDLPPPPPLGDEPSATSPEVLAGHDGPFGVGAIAEDEPTPPSLNRDFDLPSPPSETDETSPTPVEPSAPVEGDLAVVSVGEDELTPPSLNRDFELPLPPPPRDDE